MHVPLQLIHARRDNMLLGCHLEFHIMQLPLQTTQVRIGGELLDLTKILHLPSQTMQIHTGQVFWGVGWNSLKCICLCKSDVRTDMWFSAFTKHAFAFANQTGP